MYDKLCSVIFNNNNNNNNVIIIIKINNSTNHYNASLLFFFYSYEYFLHELFRKIIFLRFLANLSFRVFNLFPIKNKLTGVFFYFHFLNAPRCIF